jgi:tRNA pseudouridine55 synthase
MTDANEYISGKVLLIDKPLKWTSFDVVNKIRWLLKGKTGQKLKVGHAGTLDPLATGLLIICTGKFTKRIDEFQGQEKEYEGVFTIGATTPCFDLEKEIDAYFPVAHITDELIHQATKKFIGEQLQRPPLFSAVQIEGKRAYDLARKGSDKELPPRQIFIREFEIKNIARKETTIDIHFRISCSKGTYIRSIARDLGLALNSGAHLSALRRTRIGEFIVGDALTVEGFESQIKTD